MDDILRRLLQIARARTVRPAELLDEFLSEWEERIARREAEKRQRGRTYSQHQQKEEKRETSGAGGVPQQVAEDLELFNLRPPSSLEEVRQARNREVRKYHPDRFVNEPERFKTAEEIMQIYNAAYDRLKKYYEASE